ncbi:hypothetical protein NECAME_02243 [Necator americanus]|uniref:Uncharacterized protein n=1 Tax=Necator americanus TaxID=51031 RepID=W2TGY2_NECAM|nr:hypothetical protein NECAME_02243 [Necator americanus]ETN80844.1 hypothetical protein NECAME_02243 [Necator americanus]
MRQTESNIMFASICTCWDYDGDDYEHSGYKAYGTDVYQPPVLFFSACKYFSCWFFWTAFACFYPLFLVTCYCVLDADM